MRGEIVFSFQDEDLFFNVRTLTVEGEVLFRASDIAEALGMRGSDIVRNVDDEDDVHKVRAVDSAGRMQEVSFLTEAGLYTVLLRSNKWNAKPFRRWVTKEVLPAIRKQGFYMNEQLRAELAMKDDALKRLQAKKERKTSDGYVLVPHEEPCFEGHIPKTTYEKVPLSEVSDEQRKELLTAHNARIVAGIVKNTVQEVGVRCAFEAFYSVFKEFLPK